MKPSTRLAIVGAILALGDLESITVPQPKQKRVQIHDLPDEKLLTMRPECIARRERKAAKRANKKA